MSHAVIGTGYWGSNHVRVGAELADQGLVDDLIICDMNEERAASMAADYDTEYVVDYTELRDRIDTAVVATPSTTHHDIATDLLSAGVDCLVEKPLALESDAAWDIVETAAANDRTLGVGHIFRYHPALNDLVERIDRGELGDIRYLMTNRFALRVPRKTTGVLYSLAVHDVDIYRMLLDSNPESIYCKLDSTIRSDIAETATITADYGQATGVINESWQVPVFGKSRELVAVGSQRAAHIDYLEDNKVTIYDAKIVDEGGEYRAMDEGETVHEVPKEEPLKREVIDFVEASRGNGDLQSPGRVGAEAVDLLQYATESAAKDRVVRLD